MHITFTPMPGDKVIRARLEPDGLVINGILHPWDKAPEVVEYGEENGLRELVSLQRDHTYRVIPSTWVDPTPPPKPDPEAEAQAALEGWRQEAVAQRWQIETVMAPDEWGVIMAIEADPTLILGPMATSAQIRAVRIAINGVYDIPRISQLVDMLRYALGWTDEQADEMFRRAMAERR